MEPRYINKRTYVYAAYYNGLALSSSAEDIISIQNPGREIQLRRVIFDVQVRDLTTTFRLPYEQVGTWETRLIVNYLGNQFSEAFRLDTVQFTQLSNGTQMYIYTPGPYEFNGFKALNAISFSFAVTNRNVNNISIYWNLTVTTLEKSLNF